MPANFRPQSGPHDRFANRHADPTLKLDRDAVAAGLRRYLDAILPATHLDLRFSIELSGPSSRSATKTNGEAPGGNVDGNVASAPVAASSAASTAGFEAPEVVVVFEGSDSDVLLERGAEVLKALEHLAIRSVRLEPQFHDRVRFDCGNYRADRIAELKLSAQVAAQRVRETQAPFRFNPMPARERRIIHLVLRDQPGVRTCSEGVGEDRHLVVYRADSK